MNNGYAEYRDERLASVRVKLAAYLPLTKEQEDYVMDIFEKEMDAIKVYASTGLNRKSFSERKLEAHGSTITGKHPVNGKWISIAQVITPEGRTLYYTDGKPEKVDGGVDEHHTRVG